MTWAEYAAAWSRLHGGFDPDAASPLVRGWIRLTYRGGVLLGRLGVGPAAVTASGLALCLGVPAAALLGPAGLLLGALLVLLAAAADGLDGAVAVVTGRTSRLGFVYDSVADRLGELAWLTAFWIAGAPGWLVVAGGAVSWLHEYIRARAAAGGMPGLGVVTLGERPTRVSVAIAGLLVGGLAGLADAAWAPPVIVAAAVVWAALGLAGLAQLAAAVRAELSG
ncbi:CDP-alcohol phosphatidyltransferase family protein [Amorphoplanes digitatis]|uniref:CDP-diacylglycerol--glycerol-3-phosphate 3-phosphatidyltransferase n=1 Tax=Actinoplanes digitatis TaxID=1868 RepID=A0A7W7I3C5_9ACTN|nr:CDP-alcohol phosphatidyltransferase family protein [Actinoplanes digitatis]MBB4765513.1 CDP-diacylglycerol--glycerol-3-phosphate 3-phosphatidyltransferase [Actinoplanes digitatis]